MSNIIPRPEHPNPQMERPFWKNLNGEWEFEFDSGKSGRDRKLFEQKESFSKKITVPFCPESTLSGIGYLDFMPAVWYKKKITLTSEELENNVILHFGAVDYHSFVYVNGKEVCQHKGGYSAFSADITSYVKEGENTVVLCAEDDNRRGLQPAGKQCGSYYSYGCAYTRTTGIWQTVWLEFVPKTHIVNVRYFPDVANGALHIEAELSGTGTFTAKALWEGKECGCGSTVKAACSSDLVHLTVKLSEIHLWELGKGGLYDLELSFEDDKVKSYFGLREVALCGRKFLLNGKSVFQRLVLDQGYYPDGIYTAKDESELRKDIELSFAMGFNGARLHEKVFEPRYLYYCDKMGYMVWGEHANWGLDMSDHAALYCFMPEWMEILKRDFNHPSIIGWCPFNETWDFNGRRQIDDTINIVYKNTKLYDPTRPCIDTSGLYHTSETDIYDLHNYRYDVTDFSNSYKEFGEGGKLREDIDRQSYDYKKNPPMFVSEYGGIKWSEGTEEGDAWGYGETPKTKDEFVARYKGLTYALLDNPNITGFCYTQLYDVEQETNGLYTYGRKPKFDPEIFKEINCKKAAIED